MKIRILFFPLIMMLTLVVKSQSDQTKNDIHSSIQNETDRIYEELVAIRRNIHQNPELSGNEKQTSIVIEKYLLELGLEVKTGIGGHGVVGILDSGKEGKKIGWRADIDAIPVNAQETISFASKNEGVGHFCGHDIHTAIGLGIAKVLVKHRDQIEGTIYFIFQPAEENLTGARAMIADELFDIVHPDEMYAAHISPMPVGLVATKSENLYAEYRQIRIAFEKSEKDEEVAVFTRKLLAGLQTVEPESEFWNMQNLLDPTIGIGNPNTIYKDYVTVKDNFDLESTDENLVINGYISSSNGSLMADLIQKVRGQIEHSPYSELLADVSFYSDHIAYANDKGNINNATELAESSLKTLADLYGNTSSIRLFGVIPDSRADDFSLFQEQVPGVYFFLGGSDFQKGIIAMPHSPGFQVDERSIGFGVKYFSSLLVERLNQK